MTVGEVAKRAGLTVRTLHHYDALGLVRPSGRSASGYRLYDAADIERLHAVQSLKQLGLGLDAIGAVLEGKGVSPRELIERQIAQAEQAIQGARALKEKLLLLRDTVTEDMGSTNALLDGMHLLEAYQQHLPARRVQQSLRRWRRAAARWRPLAVELQQCDATHAPIDAPHVQQLVQRWMNLAMEIFGGELPTVLQWARMHRTAPASAIHAGLDPDMLVYVEQAIGARMAALRRHLDEEDLARIDGSTGPEWECFAIHGQALLASGTPPEASEAQRLRARYFDLLGRTVRHDVVLGEKMRRAYAAEPILAHGHFVSPELRAYLASIPA